MYPATTARTVVFVSVMLSIFSLQALASEAPHESSLLALDRSFITSVEKADSTHLKGLLNEHFTWTDAQGKTIDKTEFLANLPTTAPPAGESEPRVYGDVAVVTGAIDRTHSARVWVKEKNRWTLLAGQETTLAEKATPPKNDSTECENPCKTLPYAPKNVDEKAIIASWQALETAVTGHDAQTWADHVADEFMLANNNNDHVYTKRDRMAVLERQKQANSPSAPVPLVSAEMFDYPDAAVMKAEHRRATGNGIHVTRVWIKRDGKWIMAFSQQTTER
jgi:hypothetical protein